MGGKCWCPRLSLSNKLTAARLAADVAGVPTVLVARTDAEAAKLLTSDFDERDNPFAPANARTKVSSESGPGWN